MKPPNVYEVTTPSSQRIISRRKIVQSMEHLQMLSLRAPGRFPNQFDFLRLCLTASNVAFAAICTPSRAAADTSSLQPCLRETAPPVKATSLLPNELGKAQS